MIVTKMNIYCMTSMPKEERSAFVDANEMADNKMMGLRKGIRARFHVRTFGHLIKKFNNGTPFHIPVQYRLYKCTCKCKFMCECNNICKLNKKCL